VPPHLLIINAVVIILPILLLNVFVAFLLCASNLYNKFLVYIPNVGASRSLNEPVLLLNCFIKLLLVLLKFNDYWIKRKSFYNFFKNIFKSMQIVGKAYISEGFSKPVCKGPI
jgi:hypothetical protein